MPKTELYQETTMKNKSNVIPAYMELIVYKINGIKQKCTEMGNYKELKMP